MAKRGPKPKYDPVFAGHARRPCMMGATMQELADYFGVARCTIATWSAQYPDFGQAVAEGRLAADSVIAERLYDKAKGYEVEAERLVQIDGEWRPVSYTRRLAPDTQACIFWPRKAKDRRPHLANVRLAPQAADHLARTCRLVSRPTERYVALVFAAAGGRPCLRTDDPNR